jgi:hypothetical protein
MQEVKQLKGEWGIVMQKLAKVGSILVDVGEWYQANDMREEDLPSDLRSVLKSLQTYVPSPFFAIVLAF